jgi:hypothetical protein
MAKKYTLHYLSDKEFDKLPYTHARTSFGCADEKTGNAFVRRTGIRPIDEFVTDHELSELVAKVSPHEVDGIRYKTSGNILGKLWNSITGEPQTNQETGSYKGGSPTNTYASGGENNLSQTIANQDVNKGTVTGSLGASTTPTNTSTINQPSTTSPLNNAFENYQSNQLGFANTPLTLGGTTNNVSPNLQTINSPSSTPQTSFSSPNSIANMFSASQNKSLGTPVSLGNQNYNVTGGTEGLQATPTTNSATASSLGFETPSTTTTSPATKSNVPLQTINQAAVTPSLQTSGETSTVPATQAKSKTPFLESIFGKDWRQTLLGAGVSAIGQMTAAKTQTVNPTDSALYNQVVERVQSGTQVELTPAQTTAITQNYDTQLENARKNIIARFKALRPGSDIANDSQLKQALIELENDFAEQKAAAITAAQLGLTQQQTAQLSQLAALDINTLSTQAGVSNQEATDFKNMMASLGAMVATSGQNKIYS